MDIYDKIKAEFNRQIPKSPYVLPATTIYRQLKIWSALENKVIYTHDDPVLFQSGLIEDSWEIDRDDCLIKAS